MEYMSELEAMSRMAHILEMQRMSDIDTSAAAQEAEEEEEKKMKMKKYGLIKASPREFKTFSRQDRALWVLGQLALKTSWLVFDEKPDEVVVEEEGAKSSEESELEESESEEYSSKEESDDEPNSKES